MLDFDFNYILIYIFMSICAAFFLLKNQSKYVNLFFIIIFSIVWASFFGFRDFNIGNDTNAYLYSFHEYIMYPKLELTENIKDFGHLLFIYLVTKFTTNDVAFIFLFDCLFLIPLVLAIIKLNIKETFIFFFVFCSFFFFKSMGINIMRQGVSISFFLLGISYYLQDKKYKSYFIFVIAFLFHVSIVIPIIILKASSKFKNAKYCIILYIITLLISFLGFGYNYIISIFPQLFFIFNDRISGYTIIDSAEYEVGFRYSFVIFNSIFALIGYYFYKNDAESKFKYYNIIFYSFLILSANFFLTFDMTYSDRSGLLSWILMPFLLIPLLNPKIVKFGAIKIFLFSILIFIFFNNI